MRDWIMIKWYCQACKDAGFDIPVTHCPYIVTAASLLFGCVIFGIFLAANNRKQ